LGSGETRKCEGNRDDIDRGEKKAKRYEGRRGNSKDEKEGRPIHRFGKDISPEVEGEVSAG
jgi:hypothetical protein